MPTYAASVASVGLVAALALFLYWPAKDFEFAFDDRHAVVENKDVLGKNPWSSLVIHDFWGFEIDKFYATKSYRPLTIALWRLLHQWSNAPHEPSPYIFHFLNVIAHAAVSVQVYGLAHQVFSLTLASSCATRSRFPAIAAALLFAAHPVHTEAVAGVVGFAELLCASLGLIGLQLLLCSDETLLCYAEILARSFLGFCFLFAAALSKEIGVTLYAAVILWDTFVIPLLRVARRDAELSCSAATPSGEHSKEVNWAMEKSLQAAYDFECRELRIAITLRSLVAAFLVFTYKYGVRHTVAKGDDLVTFITKVESPFAYAPSRQVATLSVLVNHADYALLLLWPFGLSCDWSYACTDYVYQLFDARNLKSAILYAVMALLIAAVKPFKAAQRLVFMSTAPTITEGDLQRGRMTYLVLAFIVIPFLPASNIFFWVGTAKAERLLYLPSLGYVFWLADLLVARHLETSKPTEVASSALGLLRSPRILGASIILAAYCYGTIDRVPHWANQSVLFEEAYKICPNSVKVLENMGIVWMTREDLDKSEELFKAAWDIFPNRCELSYLLGLTYVKTGRIQEGTPLLREAAHFCAVRRDEAVDTLKMMVEAEAMGMAGILNHEGSDEQLTNLHYAGLARLQDQETGSLTHGCEAVETAIWGLLLSKHPSVPQKPSDGFAARVKGRYIPCIDYIIATCRIRYTDKPGWPAAACAEGRSMVAQAVARYGRRSTMVVNATHRYLSESVGKACFVDFAAITGAELCGTSPSRFDELQTDLDLRMQTLERRYAKGRLSQAHSTLLQLALKIKPKDLWLLQARAEFLAWEGDFLAAAALLDTWGMVWQEETDSEEPPLPGMFHLTNAEDAAEEADRLRQLAQWMGIERQESFVKVGKPSRKKKAESSPKHRKAKDARGKGHGSRKSG